MTTTTKTRIEFTDDQIDTLHDALITSINAQVALVKSWKGQDTGPANTAAAQLQATLSMAWMLCRVAPWMVGLKETAWSARRELDGLPT